MIAVLLAAWTVVAVLAGLGIGRTIGVADRREAEARAARLATLPEIPEPVYVPRTWVA